MRIETTRRYVGPSKPCSDGNADCSFEGLLLNSNSGITSVEERPNKRTGLMVTLGIYPVVLKFDRADVPGNRNNSLISVCAMHRDVLLDFGEHVDPHDPLWLIQQHENYLSRRTFL